MRITFYIGASFINLITEERKGRVIFKLSSEAVTDVKIGDSVILPVGDKNSRTAFGRGRLLFSFEVADISLQKSKIVIYLKDEEFSQVFKREFRKNWKIIEEGGNNGQKVC